MAVTTRRASDVSFEIGACYLPVDGGLAGLDDDAAKQVFAALIANRRDIVNAENDFHVTRLAISGAIAWEMLENAHTAGITSVGYGKEHLIDVSKKHFERNWKNGLNSGGLVGAIEAVGGGVFDPLAKQVEDAGYLPAQTFDARKLLLSTPSGAIQYIAASMEAFADLATTYGFRDISDDAVILTNVYNSRDLKDWETLLKNKPKGSAFVGGNGMDIWVKGNLKFLIAAVGISELPASGFSPAPPLAPLAPGVFTPARK